jgi:hypothetical protein
VCYEDNDSFASVYTYAVEAYATEAEAAERAQKRNEEEGYEDYYFAAQLEPDALDDQDRWAMQHVHTAIRIS